MRLCALIVLLFTTTFCAAGQTQVSGGSLIELPDGTQLAFDISGPAETKSFILNDPPRFVVDVLNARFAAKGNTQELRSMDVKSVRTGVRSGENLRIVVDLARFVRSKATVVTKGGHHLVIDVFRNDKLKSEAKVVKVETTPPVLSLVSMNHQSNQPVIKPVLTKPVIRATSETEAPEQTARKSAVEEQEAAAQTPRPKPVPVYRYKQRDLVIAIDPGHGGKDPGAMGPRGTKEKHVVLQIARRLKRLIDNESGMRAILTRSSDKYLHLYQRIDIARQQKADLFISIHADAYQNRGAHGSSVFILSTKGASSAAARWLAQKENKADYIGGALGVKDKALTPVVLDIVHDAVLADSMILAEKVLKQLSKVNSLHKKKVERAGFAVLKAPDMPSILVETAFISNNIEESKLRGSKYQREMADAIMKGIRDYFRARPRQPRQIIAQVPQQDGQKVHVIQRGESLTTIARRYRISVSDLRLANGMDREQQRILAGTRLIIPGVDS